MNRAELLIKLQKENVPRDMYSLAGGFPYEAFCLGEKDGLWEVYYSERGRKTSLKTFMNEEEACQVFYDWIMPFVPEWYHGRSSENYMR